MKETTPLLGIDKKKKYKKYDLLPPPIPIVNGDSNGFCQPCIPISTETDTDTVKEEELGPTVRSTLDCKGICCSAEIPMVHRALRGLPGISKTMINVALRQVSLDHDPALITAREIEQALNLHNLDAVIQRDGGDLIAAPASFVRSTLRIHLPESVDKKNTNNNTNNNAIEDVQKALNSLDSKALESFVVAGTVITLHHSPLLLPLENILQTIQQQTNIQTTIASNGANEVQWDFPTYEQHLADMKHPDVHNNTQLQEHDWPKPTVIASGIFWFGSMFSCIGGVWDYLKYLALFAVAFGIPTIAQKAFGAMKRSLLDSNCLMFFAAIGALAFQEYTEAAAVTFLFAVSEWLETRAMTRGRNALSAIVNLRPDFAWIIHPNTQEQLLIPASAVPLGAIVAVRAGDKIPCDGVVIEGESSVNESSLTGESMPVPKHPQSLVAGGTLNCGKNHLIVQTTATAEDSATSRLIALVEEAQANRSETEKMVDEFAKVYTPVIVLAALAMCTIPWFWGVEVGREWTHNGLVLIVIACPCALIISTPVCYVAGLAATAQRGVLVKGGAHLESLGLIQTLCLDKTGTITRGSFALIDVTPIGTKYTRQEILEYLVLMEERANHPLAVAIVDGAKLEGITPPSGRKVTSHNFLEGEGLSGTIDGKQIYVGNTRLFNRLNLLDDLEEEIDNTIWNWERMAGIVGFMSIDGVLVCAYCVADAIRPEAMEVIETLRKMDIDVHMLTGDSRNAANAIGQVVDLNPDSIHSDLLPEEKLKFITDRKNEHAGRTVFSNLMGVRNLVCHVGDGVNDAPALAAADLGVAMGIGAALAMETASVTLLDSNLNKLQFSIQMGRNVLWKIRENVAFSLLVKAAILGLTVMGKVALWGAIASDVGSMIIVSLNGMLLLPRGKIDAETMGDIGNVSYKSQSGGEV